MSTFKVSVERIGKIYPHPNADKLELAQVKSMTFQFCISKGVYSVDDTVAYFPVDSVLPKPLVDFLQIENFLSGKAKNRIKTVKLRGEISQGFVIRTNVLSDYILQINEEKWKEFGNLCLKQTGESTDILSGYDLTEVLGVTKYEPPEVPCHAGNLVRHPDGIVSYDIEGCDRYPDVVSTLLPMKVFVSEKLEGQNFYSTLLPDGTFVVGQRNYSIVPIEGAVHDFWALAQKFNHKEILEKIKVQFGAQQVTIRAEAIGPSIQGNIYNLKEKTLFIFDILIDGKYASAEMFRKLCFDYGMTSVPIICFDTTLSDWLSGKTIQQASNGQSVLAPVLREGIVIKPMIEHEYAGLHENRLILKQRDPVYLLKTKDE